MKITLSCEVANFFLLLIAGTRGATLTLAAGASIGARVLLSLHAPENAAGTFIVDRALVIHFLAPQVTARAMRRGRFSTLDRVVLHSSPHVVRVDKTARLT